MAEPPSFDLDALAKQLAQRPNDRLEVVTSDNAIELRWGPEVPFSQYDAPERTFAGRVALGLGEVFASAAGFFCAGWMKDWQTGLMAAAAGGLAALLVLFDKARREHRVKQRAGTMVVTSNSLVISDEQGIAEVEVSKLLDVDSGEGSLEIITTNGVVTAMASRSDETRIALATAMRHASGLGFDRQIRSFPNVESTSDVSIRDDGLGREVTVRHGRVSKGVAEVMKWFGLFGALYTVVGHPELLRSWVIAAPLLLFGLFFARPAPTSRLRIHDDARFLLEPHVGEVVTGDIRDVSFSIAHNSMVTSPVGEEPTADFTKRSATLQAALRVELSPHDEVVLDIQPEPALATVEVDVAVKRNS